MDDWESDSGPLNWQFREDLSEKVIFGHKLQNLWQRGQNVQRPWDRDRLDAFLLGKYMPMNRWLSLIPISIHWEVLIWFVGILQGGLYTYFIDLQDIDLPRSRDWAWSMTLNYSWGEPGNGMSHWVLYRQMLRRNSGECCLLGINDHKRSFPGGADGKEAACNAGNPVSIPESWRSPGEGNGNPLQYSYLENPMDRGAWRATVHGVAKSQIQLSN